MSIPTNGIYEVKLTMQVTGQRPDTRTATVQMRDVDVDICLMREDINELARMAGFQPVSE